MGAGKTRAGTVQALRMPRGSTGMVVAPTYPMLRDATLRTFLELTESARILRGFHKAEMTARLAGGRTVLFRSAEKPERLRGPNLGWFWIDEAAMCKVLTWLIMIGRLRETPGCGWLTTTPRGKDWLYKLFVENPNSDPRYDFVRASSRTNQFLPPDFVQSLIDGYDEHFRQQEVDGEFLDDTFGQLVPDWQIDQVPRLIRPEGSGGRRWLTCDLGEGGGRDSTVKLVGDKLGILHGTEDPWEGPAQAAVGIRELMSLWGIAQERVVYDAGGGRGLDIEPYLERLGITEAIPYKGSGSGGSQFEQKRTKMGWMLRQRLDPDRPKPPPPMSFDPERHKASIFDPPPKLAIAERQDPFTVPYGWGLWQRLAEEIRACRWHHKGRVIALEPKEKLQERLRRSPNVLDALFMSFDLDDEAA